MTERTIFLTALDITDPGQRSAYLDEVCSGDAALRQRVDALLRSHEQAGSLLSAASPVEVPNTGLYADPGEQAATPVEGVGGRVGPYKLLELIGEGGMGLVFVAEQSEPVRRKVALKVIKPGMDSAQVVARFEAERQALALMDHPNIAKVFDGGTTESRRPFFVMELVKGVPLTSFCDQYHFTLRQRLELFVPVCQAIQHAHTKGVIHRDIKPTNVLVAKYDDRPVPKVIDFGIAKATGVALTERTLHTGFAAVVGTLEYMSPEQASFNQLDVDTRSDVYSLGVLLYELLAGAPPFSRQELEQAGVLEMFRLIREQEPPRPSTKLSTADGLPTLASNRGTEPKKLAAVVRGELDWIVMKALEKDRSRRYETANGLAMDVQRYLTDEPVQACPPSTTYRLRKLARRYRTGLVTAALVMLVLSVAAAVSVWQAIVANIARRNAETAGQVATTERDKAQTERAVASAVNEFFQNEILQRARADEEPDRELKLRTVLDRASRRIPGQFDRHPLVEAAIRLNIGEAYVTLGEQPAAVPHLERALSLYRQELGAGHADSVNAMHSLGWALLLTGQPAKADALFEEALSSAQQARERGHPMTLMAAATVGYRATLRGDHARAERLITEALAVGEEVQGSDNHHVASLRQRLGGLYTRMGRLPEAERILTQHLTSRRRQLGDSHTDTLYAMMTLAELHQRQRRDIEAEVLANEALRTRTRVLGSDHFDTRTTQRMLAELHVAQKRLEEAEKVYTGLVEAARRLDGPKHAGTISVQVRLGNVLHDRGDHPRAEPIFREVLASCQHTFGETHLEVGLALRLLGRSLVSQERYAEAEDPLRESLAILAKSPGWNTANVQTLLGRALIGQKKYAEAEPLLLRAYEVMTRPQASRPATAATMIGEVRAALVRLYDAWGKKDKADEWRAKPAK